MSDSSAEPRRRASGRRITMAAAGLVIALALGAVLWPGSWHTADRAVLLVFDSSGDASRETLVFGSLENFLSRSTGRFLDLVVVGDRGSFNESVVSGVDFILCPDGLGLGLDPDMYLPLAVGRRPAPRNLRPRGVLVYRKSAGLVDQPWRDRARATVIGDSLSLVATGAWRRRSNPGSPWDGTAGACAWGPDPYDHAPVLHAARLGAYDYALVRQWDADRFFESGLLSALDWGIEIMTIPVPDLVLFCSRDLPADKRLAVGEALASLGREQDEGPAEARSLREGLRALHLVGFNLLMKPDYDLVRNNFTADWPPTAD